MSKIFNLARTWKQEETIKLLAPEDLTMASDDEDKNDETEIQHYGIDIRRKLKLEAHVTSGCGKHKEKIRTIDTFWDKVWPTLEAQGWTKVRR